MKKLYKLSFIILIPLITGIILTVAGIVTGNDTVLGIGIIMFEIVLPAVMFILVVVGLILLITGRLSDKPKSPECNNEPVRDREKEQSDLDEINTSHGYKNWYDQGEYMIDHTANNYKNSTGKERILGWLFFGFLITDFALIPIFAFLGITLGAIICLSIFGGTIILSLIIKTVLEKTSMRINPYKIKNKEILRGIVKACLLSSTTSVGGNITTRITKVVYRVIISVDDKEYTAYSKEFYNTGDEVTFAVIGKHRAAIISDEN